MPYDAARARVRIGVACLALGDHDGADLELNAARTVLELDARWSGHGRRGAGDDGRTEQVPVHDYSEP